jgi:hypothetical protein
MNSQSQGLLVAVVAGAAGCTELDPIGEHVCPFSDAPAESLPFTAAEVLASAAASWTGDASTTDAVPTLFPASVDDTFDLDGTEKIVDFGPEAPHGVSCPVGLALYLPVVHHRTGTIGTWAFSQDFAGVALVATAVEQEALSFVSRSLYPDMYYAPAATVDEGLRSLALTSDFAGRLEEQGVDCSDPAVFVEYSVITPRTVTAGSWSRSFDDGDLSLRCGDRSEQVIWWGDQDI